MLGDLVFLYAPGAPGGTLRNKRFLSFCWATNSESGGTFSNIECRVV